MPETRSPVARRFVALAGLAPKQLVLVLGSRTGTLAVEAKQIHPDTTIVGVDADPAMVARARRRAERGLVVVRFDLGHPTDLPYGGNTFDRVLAGRLLHLAPAVSAVSILLQVLRILRPEGRLSVLLPGVAVARFAADLVDAGFDLVGTERVTPGRDALQVVTAARSTGGRERACSTISPRR